MSKGKHRTSAAELARAVRAMWPDLAGEWTRRDWNNQARATAHNHIARMRRMDRMEQAKGA